MGKKYKLNEDQLEELVSGMGSCIATDKITVEGMQVGFMYREEPTDNLDSGWRFFSGTENFSYVKNPANSEEYDVNTIANYDKAIIPYLESQYGTELERIKGTDEFRIIFVDEGE
jgi:hypothetical protein